MSAAPVLCTCGGTYSFRDGKLRCDRCPGYFYGYRGFIGIYGRSNMPVDVEAAHAALDAAYAGDTAA